MCSGSPEHPDRRSGVSQCGHLLGIDGGVLEVDLGELGQVVQRREVGHPGAGDTQLAQAGDGGERAEVVDGGVVEPEDLQPAEGALRCRSLQCHRAGYHQEIT